LRFKHLAPPLDADHLPPAWLFHRLLLPFIDTVDQIARAITPPNMYLFKQFMGYVHTVQIYTAADLKLADALADGPKCVSLQQYCTSSNDMCVQICPGAGIIYRLLWRCLCRSREAAAPTIAWNDYLRRV
jgi:hypothetical protein